MMTHFAEPCQHETSSSWSRERHAASAGLTPEGSIQDTDIAGAGPIDPEQLAWQQAFGESWVAALGRFARWARRAGIPIQAGSAALLSSRRVQQMGWGTVPATWFDSSGPVRVPSHGSWILRVPPGAAAIVRQRLEACPALHAQGNRPSLQIEETPLAYLPSDFESVKWPSAEGWLRADVLIHGRRRNTRPIVPESEQDLLDGISSSTAPDQALLRAWDLWRAAASWKVRRAAYWMARHSMGFADVQEALDWRRRASDWNVRVLEAHVDTSAYCAQVDGSVVRLGIHDMATTPPSRTLRRHRQDWRRLARTSRMAEVRGWWGRLVSSVRRLVGRSFPQEAPVIRFRTEGGKSPFLPHTVIAHNPRPAALRSNPVLPHA